MLKKLDPRRKITTYENAPFLYGFVRIAAIYVAGTAAAFLVDRFYNLEEETVDLSEPIDTTGTEEK